MPENTLVQYSTPHEHDLLAAWRVHLARLVQAGELSEHSADSYQRGMIDFLDWYALAGSPRLDADVIRDYAVDLRQRYDKPNTVNARMAGVRAFFRWAAQYGHLASDPTAQVQGAKRRGTKRQHLRDALTDGEVRRLLQAFDRQTPAGKRDYCVAVLMLYTGIRTIEAHRADLGDLRTVQQRLTLYVLGKGKQDREPVVLPQRAIDALLDWLAARGDAPGPLFLSLSNRSPGSRLSTRSIRAAIKDAMLRAGINSERKTTHSLRHTAITKVVQTAGPMKAREMARHENLETTMVYTHEVGRISDPGEDYIDYGD